MAYSINNHEQIVGTAQSAMGNYHAFMFQGGRMIDLGTMGGSNSWAYGLNDNCWMVGGAEMTTTNPHAFLCTNALMNPSMMDLGTLGGSNSTAWMINLRGEMVGWGAMSNGRQHAFFMTNSLRGSMMDLGTAGGTNSEALCLNSNRMVVGYATTSSGSLEPIVSTNPMSGSSSMLPMNMGAMGASGGQSWFVNDLGDTAGRAEMAGGNYHAFASGPGGMMGRMNVDLGTLGGSNSIAYCINNANSVVGTAQTSNGMMHAFIYTNALGGLSQMMDLNELIPSNSGWVLMEARGMNALGQIVGWGMFEGHTNAFLLTPVSAPMTMTVGAASQIVGPGATVKLEMQMSTGETLSYQWLHHGNPVQGGTAATLNVAGMSAADAGQYTVTARNSVGTVANSSAVVGMFGAQLGNREPRLTVAGPVGSRFRIDYGVQLGSGANWLTMTNLTLASSVAQVGDTLPQGTRERFYRAVLTP